ncbi:hypothetical protein M8J76_014951 [Diaphorina citri]|nr:hypothetical protein M8J76_014951 [Diaphorina citri]
MWQGYIKIVNNDYKICIQCPEFPYTKNATLEFDNAANAVPVNYSSMLNKLKLKSSKLNKLLDNLVKFIANNSNTSASLPDFNAKYLLYKDLETIRENITDLSDDMSHMSLVYVDNADRSHSLSIQVDSERGNYLDMDLPEEIAHTFSEANKFKPVSSIYRQFCQRINDLQALFFMCDLLDEQTTVLEPANPTRKHTQRKIGLTIEVKLNPYDVYSCPNIEVVGEETSVAAIKTTLEFNMKETGWDEDLNIIENLVRVLDIEEFPDLHSRLESTQAQLGEGECSICLSMRHAVTMETPVKLCSNEKCASFYHEVCLSKWLQSIPTSDIGFGMVTGKCPLCKMTISCRLVDEDD